MFKIGHLKTVSCNLHSHSSALLPIDDSCVLISRSLLSSFSLKPEYNAREAFAKVLKVCGEYILSMTGLAFDSLRNILETKWRFNICSFIYQKIILKGFAIKSLKGK